MSTSSKVFASVLVLSVALILYGLYRFNRATVGAASSGAPVTVEIPEGVGADEVGDLLSEAGVIDSALAFRVLSRVDPRSSQIQPGSYQLRKGMGVNEVLDIITQPPEPAPTFTVTIPEGLTVGQALARIAEAEDSPFTVEELTQALAGVALPEWVPTDLPEGAEPFEGLLFPDTYEFRVEEGPQNVLSRLVRETETRLSELEPSADYTPYALLTIASLIEREVRVPEERPLVSSVIGNRLAREQRLQIDATVLYALGEVGERVMVDDTDVQSPWNTYRNEGLPPTPIAAAGQAALEAAANPADTDFHFYVVCDTETGEHAFARNLDQHQSNQARYREIRDAGGGSYCDEVA